MQGKSARLEDLEIYQLAMEIVESVWNTVDKWQHFSKITVGEQLVDAADSVAANIAERVGRYFYKDRKLFCYYSRGSLLKSKAWLTKSKNRGLILESEFVILYEKMSNLHYKLNVFIKNLKDNTKPTK
jgi:four helix bundle protein